ncbi:MAG: N-acetylmuramoyl-L-alanine amidase [Phycisphaerae bacterium]|nr:N-acetylmuramoyl-L-alanine amidase [Phycisphaerae bacterium]
MAGTVVVSTDEGERMFTARTGKVLGSLLAAMTIGALLLMLMESDPPRPSESDLAGVRAVVLDETQPLASIWRRIVVHASDGGKDTLPSRCHFIVRATPDANGEWVAPTSLWRQQTPGQHIYVPDKDYNAESIGVCLMGEFDVVPPSRGQFQALLRLVRELQRSCNIPAENVYLRRQLHDQPPLPGNAFPVGTFDRGLLRADMK